MNKKHVIIPNKKKTANRKRQKKKKIFRSRFQRRQTHLMVIGFSQRRWHARTHTVVTSHRLCVLSLPRLASSTSPTHPRRTVSQFPPESHLPQHPQTNPNFSKCGLQHPPLPSSSLLSFLPSWKLVDCSASYPSQVLVPIYSPLLDT